MSRFYFQWPGNKRQEIKHVDEVVDWEQFDTVVEPFAGSAALTLELHARGLGKRHVINDIDPHLITMLRFIAANTSTSLYDYCGEHLTVEEYRQIHATKPSPGDICTWFYQHRVVGDFGRASVVPKKWPNLVRGARQIAADACFAAATITNEDWRATVDRHKDDPRALLFIDPPYFNSFNQSYYGMDGVKCDANGRILDGTALFLEMLEYLRTAAATVIVITNSCAIIDHIMAPYIRKRYHKNYATMVRVNGANARKSTDHIILVGGGVLESEADDAARMPVA